MIGAFTRAFGQLGDPPVFRVVIRAVIGAVIIYALLIAALTWALSQAWVQELPLIGTIAAFGAGIGGFILATLLFPGVVSALTGLWLEDIAFAVEARHYPHLGPARKVPLNESLAASLRLGAFTVALNILLLPLYLVLFFIPPLNLAVYYGINGRLLGREYFETVALRRVDTGTMDLMRRAHGGSVWFAGGLTAFLLTVPLLNMLAPVIGAAAMVHVFHKLTRDP